MTEQVIIIGAGQAGLSTAYYLQRQGITPLILDANQSYGGAWLNAWDSLKLFSPRQYSSLSGYTMPSTSEEYPTKTDVINYFGQYEQRYNFNIKRPVTVLNVEQHDNLFIVKTNMGEFTTKVLISATGNFSGPFIPNFEGINDFKGMQVHSSEYANNSAFASLNVAVVGSGNSGSQILAEVSKVANTHWFTNRPLEFLDDELDGRYLFELSTKQYQASLQGKTVEPSDDFSKIVMVDAVKEARERDVLTREENIVSFGKNTIKTANKTIPIDAVIWCTGFKANLAHLAGLNLSTDLSALTKQTHSVDYASLWLVGYGEWTGFASATILGVQKYAKQTATQVHQYLQGAI
ncbi:NAD(P)/FAD-dependent oxidoreductase [Pseudoalteromonas sp. SG45-5]|uniref:ArsO family NAD(P)H-dependent flavin-containing monooxygenase n=1 Tax=unclassified Pseudoalteromonas TaxID=194690 RepID=UPI0015F87AC7|nr:MULTISPECIES: ArsO family NAD(P)H-dependent flavin-containing monooxygenase [unclassified Pseudoalteromonas]MBB1386611.1 NAD(P)/FAD-dependent oxidoreductase [Pseudoalteromonas sp. SG45-5]MBB1394649.1 NAD(P)/FAD-dependent oxidoreductase [Pseudoalteromonas sp. SG44-4]MBB1448667.1 NAD(P)/FAD-dependent oxidoreductase [Pseudoalteromonas sp. SG41-6]